MDSEAGWGSRGGLKVVKKMRMGCVLLQSHTNSVSYFGNANITAFHSKESINLTKSKLFLPIGGCLKVAVGLSQGEETRQVSRGCWYELVKIENCVGLTASFRVADTSRLVFTPIGYPQ
jgi:hypothetical protein